MFCRSIIFICLMTNDSPKIHITAVNIMSQCMLPTRGRMFMYFSSFFSFSSWSCFLTRFLTNHHRVYLYNEFRGSVHTAMERVDLAMNPSQIEYFIGLYRDQEHLWNSRHQCYNVRSARTLALHEIASKMGDGWTGRIIYVLALVFGLGINKYVHYNARARLLDYFLERGNKL